MTTPTHSLLAPNFPVAATCVVLQPDAELRYEVLAQLLKTPSAVYLNLASAQGTLTDLMRAIEHSAATHALDLAQVRHLMLDEADGVNAAVLAALIQRVVTMHPQIQIIIAGRAQPSVLLQHLHLKDRAQVYPQRTATPYAPPQERKNGHAYAHTLDVRAYGSGQVWLNGQPITTWDGALPRNLFFYLIDRGLVTRADIFATFWPSMSAKEATNVFHVTKRKIGEILNMDLTVYTSGYYCLAPNIRLNYDVRHFAHLVQQSDVATTPTTAAHYLTEAVRIAAHGYLNTVKADWAVQRRLNLKKSLSEALVTLAEIKHHLGETDAALNLLLRAAVNDLSREDIVRDIVTLCQQMGHAETARCAYQRLAAYRAEHHLQPPSEPLQRLTHSL